MEKREFNLNELEGFNHTTKLEGPVRVFIPERAILSIFQETLIFVACNLDFGEMAIGTDTVRLFRVNLFDNKVDILFPLETEDKRASQAGTLETHNLLGLASERIHIVRDQQGEIIFAFPRFQGTKQSGNIRINITDESNLQIDLFSVQERKENRQFLVFSYNTETIEWAIYFLVISVKTLENPYKGIEFFFPPKLEE